MDKKFIKIFDEEVFYVEENTGKEKVLFLHGFNSSHNFAQQLYLLKNRNYDVVAIDFPGCGKSSANSEITIEYYQKIAQEFVKQINYNFKLVVGHSLGGASALYLLNSKMVNYALLAAPINYNILSAKLDETTEKLKRWLIPSNLNDAIESSENLVFNNKNGYKENLNKIATMFLKITKFKERNFLKLVTNQIINPNYLKKEIKKLYTQSNNYEFIIGINDMFVPFMSVAKIANDLNKNLSAISNCGHAIFFEKPEQVNEKINKLISSL
ncbi:alpha/beta fold hydrolase [Mesomycoplasma lagogenitalium]|uniref:Alpha/beta hydrolase n=1 Tax=Mesomycoplasma lagogenitalium TaxID=171286 RepID=A0ABY8LVE1_9BACT|nr:alpha/beta hydrolase [Mesomycoplasma lagogenitalium]WGI36735.1 alpha/beta hydrolase [Mesomycoplasma lagogenitalium]